MIQSFWRKFFHLSSKRNLQVDFSWLDLAFVPNIGDDSGVLWFFVSFRIFFSDNTRVRIFIFLSRKARNFFPEFNIRLYDKNPESDYLFFSPPKSEYFFQQYWESEYFFRKKTYPPPFKLNGRSLREPHLRKMFFR
jgi:hypothetical protein